MFRTYIQKNNHLAFRDLAVADAIPPEEADQIVWFDLINPTPEEDHFAERLFGITIPTRAEMNEIELSARLYSEDNAKFMTMTVITKLDIDAAEKTPITFILKGQTLLTVRYEETKSFTNFAFRVQKMNTSACSTGEQALLGLLEAVIDRIADTLERVDGEVDGISRDVFRNKAPTATKKTRDLQGMIERIGRKDDLLSMVHESLLSISRLLAYYASEPADRKASKASLQKGEILHRDAASLSEHAAFLSDKTTFLLDATLGLINLEQNQIIKIFSVAAVVFLPPTLVASVYGMNFDLLPELRWVFGYPWALGLMLLSALLPFLYFKKRGWL
ncbi:MAG: magnesium transporter CorA family protein [Pseudomonadota bacterium]